MRSNTALVALISTACLVSSATGQIAKQGSTYEFKPKFTAGSSSKYAINITSKGGGQNFTMNSSITQKVLSVKNGVAEIEVTQGAATVNGKRESASQPPQKVKWDMKANKPVGQEFAMFTAGIPNKPMKVGESFKSSLPMMGPGVQIAAIYRFVGMKNVGGKQAAHFDIKVEKQANFPGTASGSIYFQASDCSVISSVVNAKMTMNGPDGKAVTMELGSSIKRA